MNRYKQREQALLLIFESQFSDDGKDELCNIFEENIEELGEYSKELFFGVYDNADILDEKIKAYSKGWRLSRIPKINIALLRLAIYESLFVDSVPTSIAINEAVELAKKYSGDEDASFINGILGSVVRGNE
ncbi:MAG: transcription antitermination factor NusB [Ruminococcaceae bacterium]|nr:transcription antitermination factor NusB [Oscillospiraceae bacterium]